MRGPLNRFAVLASAGLLLTACTTGGQTAPPSTMPSPAASAQSSAQSPVTVRLLAHDSFVVSESLIADLKERTGITLEIVSGGDAGTMVAGAILAAGAPTADVMFGVDNTLVSKAVDAGVFAEHISPNLGSVIPELKDDTAGGQVTPIDYGDVCVNIDDTWFAEKGIAPPTRLEDLTRPEYRDLLVVQDPATSSPGLAFMLATVATYGEAWPDYWTRLQANGVKVASSWTDAYEGSFTRGGGGGDRPLVVSYATSPPAEIVYAADPKPERPSTSVMTDGCYRQVEYAGVLAGTPNEAAARTVVDWLLSEPVQADVPLSMFVFPARAGTPLPDVFTEFAATVPSPLQLDAAEVAASLPSWLEAWGEVMGR